MLAEAVEAPMTPRYLLMTGNQRSQDPREKGLSSVLVQCSTERTLELKTR